MQTRTLNFIVDNQIIKRDPSCSFDGLVPGSAGYIKAKFIFVGGWDDCVKVAAFYDRFGVECPPKKLDVADMCEIPAEALRSIAFSVQLVGKSKDYTVTTNRVVVNQTGGRA